MDENLVSLYRVAVIRDGKEQTILKHDKIGYVLDFASKQQYPVIVYDNINQKEIARRG